MNVKDLPHRWDPVRQRWRVDDRHPLVIHRTQATLAAYLGMESTS